MIPTTISTLLTDLLATCVAAYSQAGVTVTAPARRYVTHGTAVWAGEQLTVAWSGFRPVAPFPLTQLNVPKAAVVPTCDMRVEVVRDCWPVPQTTAANKRLASPESITAAALLLALDVGAIGAYLQTLSVEGGMFPSIPAIDTSNKGVTVGIAQPTGPQGQLAGLLIPVSVKLAIP